MASMHLQKSMSIESEAGFRVLFECAKTGMLIVEESGKIALSNPCAEELSGHVTFTSRAYVGTSFHISIPYL